jgi:hypothetical protein
VGFVQDKLVPQFHFYFVVKVCSPVSVELLAKHRSRAAAREKAAFYVTSNLKVPTLNLF